MYSENVGRDIKLFCKAFLSNQLARFAPTLYVKLTQQTGRGRDEHDASEIADYFIRCFQDYQDQFSLNALDLKAYLQGKSILEYGPGDILGVALVFYAYGAEKIRCIDRFPLSKLSDKNIAVYQQILTALPETQRDRAAKAFNEIGNPASGFNPDVVVYQVANNGLSGSNSEKYDLIISRAVLEHVNNLEETMKDIKAHLQIDGVSLHQVDLKSHGLDRDTPFDFLTWPTGLYHLMYSHKGFPNRWRVNKYQALAESAGLAVKKLTPTERLDPDKLVRVLPSIVKEFRGASGEELSWLGFWMLLQHASTPPDQ